MAVFETKDIRTVAIAGHGQTGKTTLLEHLLFVSDAISSAGKTGTGKTVSDNTPEEFERHISIYSSLANTVWNSQNNEKIEINFWDTPGASDFSGEVISAFRASEMALMLVDGTAGVQIETVKLWRDLDRRAKPRFVFVNQIDDDKSDFDSISKNIHSQFNVETCSVTIPIGKGASYKGVIDVLNNKCYLVPQEGQKENASEIPAEYNEEVKNALGVLAGAAAEGDDDLLVKFIDEGELTKDEIIKGLKKAFAENKIVPVFCGAPEKNSGLVPVLNFISEISLSPDGSIETAVNKNGDTSVVKINSEPSFTALVVKTAGDQFSGKLSYLKIITGSVSSDSDVFDVSNGRKEHIGKIYHALGKKLIEIQQASSGDIVVAAKLSSVETSDTLSAEENALPYKKLRHPNPVYSIAVEALNKKDDVKLGELLSRVTETDKTITWKFNAETKQNVLSGMGELQLGIILDKIKAETKMEIKTEIPRIAYRETVQRKAEAEYTHKKQSGGHGQYAKVVLSVQPLPRGENYKFTNAVFGGAIPKNFIPGVEKGVKEAMLNGVTANYPVVDVAVTVLDGKYHPVDSSDLAFQIAARNAFKDAMRASGPILLEPIMNINIWVETKYLGDIMSDISAKRGRILGQDSIGGGIEEIRAQIPHAELLRYAIELRSMTSSTGSFETSFDHYDPVSGKLADEVIELSKKIAEQSE
ncbi:MAG: elongation factor G [Treponema sp.]